MRETNRSAGAESTVTQGGGTTIAKRRCLTGASDKLSKNRDVINAISRIIAKLFHMQQRSVALLIESSTEYARGLLRGVLRYQEEFGRWKVDLPEQHRGADPPSWLRRYPGDGILARIETDKIAQAVRATGLPTIDLSAARRLPDIPWLETDDQQIADMAVEHFSERGLRALAFCGEVEFNWACWRRDAFVAAAQSRGLEVSVFDIPPETARSTWARQRPKLVRWIRDLPSPCGLMAAYDSLARRILDLCDEAGRSVPDSIAVLGVDDDPLLCRLASPPLTSVIPDAERAGYVAAELLEKMMGGQVVPATGTLLPPIGISTRRSTDPSAVDDPEIENAARYILANACSGIRVGDVVATTSMTRRALELRFKAMLGKTPHEMIVATRIQRAERLLRETSFPLDLIARRCGIEHAEYLSVMFRKQRGITPGKYRASFR